MSKRIILVIFMLFTISFSQSIDKEYRTIKQMTIQVIDTLQSEINAVDSKIDHHLSNSDLSVEETSAITDSLNRVKENLITKQDSIEKEINKIRKRIVNKNISMTAMAKKPGVYYTETMVGNGTYDKLDKIKVFGVKDEGDFLATINKGDTNIVKSNNFKYDKDKFEQLLKQHEVDMHLFIHEDIEYQGPDITRSNNKSSEGTQNQTVKVINGNSSGVISKKTSTFTVESPWKVIYRAGENAMGWSMLSANLYNSSGDYVTLLFNKKNNSGSLYGSSNCYQSGTFYLDLTGQVGSYNIKIVKQ